VSHEGLRILAHPVSDPLRLPIESWSLAALAAMLVIAAGAIVRRSDEQIEPLEPFEPRTRAHWAARVAGTALLLGALVVSRTGSPFELENPSSVLFVAFLWPVLAPICFAWPTFWDRIDPFDTLARIFESREEQGDEPERDVRIAVAFAVAWTCYLGVYTQPLKPESFGLLVGGYTIAMLAGSLALGRKSWLRRAEFFGVFYRMLGESRRWTSQPRGISLLLGVAIGGLLFGVLRLTSLWGDLNVSDQATLWGTTGLLVCSAIAFGGLELARRMGSDRSAVVLAAAPYAGAVVLAVGLLRNRLFVAAQLLPRLLTDPMDAGLDPLGQADAVVDPNPLGTTGLVMTQIVILTLGAGAGAMLARRRAGTEANAAIGVICVFLIASILLVAGVAFPG
jgi:hypothetical protein